MRAAAEGEPVSVGRLARFLAAAPGLAAALPGRALACPTCFSAKAGVLPAYLGTAVLLSLLPFALIGGIVLWFRRRTRARDAAHGEAPRPT